MVGAERTKEGHRCTGRQQVAMVPARTPVVDRGAPDRVDIVAAAGKLAQHVPADEARRAGDDDALHAVAPVDDRDCGGASTICGLGSGTTKRPPQAPMPAIVRQISSFRFQGRMIR